MSLGKQILPQRGIQLLTRSTMGAVFFGICFLITAHISPKSSENHSFFAVFFIEYLDAMGLLIDMYFSLLFRNQFLGGK